ncbi:MULTISPECIES: biliverdin-producing heme oxygenase [Prochlorococcus]|uniref:Heme oxygenase n=2 Tax=Prochlorococcus marinus TaxID=1219 RepID=Q7V9S7_PROMA|nr:MULTISPECIES: biliverdin-producing heme oxygenase [Prochlorococcus]AAQ00794.1 Heme oxygenase [Prochlorococcus marinus subsp. marinus str. CCMP1375]KGG10712.1 Heme oxygenase [Prochlorococcus marinus str. LG]KGG21133.1 Heme oxygenase [Prochlorococcus marinus str. SS2]KGG23957.1 Heme oxygenase [Prochlorococcus marinus str. SS35]KGG31782.1 Heme oxygenase [Prochlorococcus marinus str. SS51]
MPLALAIQLREGTKKSHTLAENTGFVSCFLKGVVDKSTYRKLMADLYFVYLAMEDEIGRLSKANHPVVSLIGFQELNRLETIEQDLHFYFGEDWSDLVQPSSSAKAYVDRIRHIAKATPELLVGHHYTRYIGDLSGGQILSRIARKAMNLTGKDGLRFYEFEQISDQKEFKLKYTQTLNTLPIDQEMADSIIDEANLAFKYNMDMFKELEGNLIGVIGKLLFSFLTRKSRRGSTESV